MQNILIGIIAGIISGMGMGGGTILIYCLTLGGIAQHTAQACNLVFFIPTSIASIIVNVKNKNVDFKLAKIIIVWGILGATIGAKISVKLDVESLRKYFGIFLLTIVIFEVKNIILKK